MILILVNCCAHLYFVTADSPSPVFPIDEECRTCPFPCDKRKKLKGETTMAYKQ